TCIRALMFLYPPSTTLLPYTTLFRSTNPTGGLRLTVEDGEINLTGVHLGQYLGHAFGFNVGDFAQVNGRSPTDCVDDRVAHLCPVAENKDPLRSLGHPRVLCASTMVTRFMLAGPPPRYPAGSSVFR